MTPKRKWNCVCIGISLFITLTLALTPAIAAPKDLSSLYKLKYSIETFPIQEDTQYKLKITSDDKGRVELELPFTSGGCIAINELKVRSVETAHNGMETVNLFWKCDMGRPCKAMIPVKLRAGIKLPNPGRYWVKLWGYESVDSEKVNLVGEQEIEFK